MTKADREKQAAQLKAHYLAFTTDVLKLRETYEIMDPAAIGIPTGDSIVLTKVSGRHGLRARMSWFQATPLGRTLNRFSSDIAAIDQQVEFAPILHFLP